MDDPSLWIALVALLISCYFASCHVALKTHSRSKLTELMEVAGKTDRMDHLLQKMPRLQLVTGTLCTCLNLVMLLAVLYGVEARHDPNGPTLATYIIAFVISGGMVSVFGVAIPLSIGRYVPENLLARSMTVLHLSEVLFRPMAAALYLFDPIVRRVSGSEIQLNDEELVSDKIMTVVEDQEAEGAVDSGQKQMIEAVIDLTDTTAGEVMTPRTDMKGIEVNATLEQVKAAILRDGHSRIPVYEGDVDHIVGMLYAKDLLRFLGDVEASPFALRSLLREALMVPESKWIRQLLGEFKARKVHIAIVLDEYGGTAGLVTIEDILEELVGEIQDEYEPTTQDPEIRRIDEKTFEVDARVHVDDVNDVLNIRLPEDEDYETIGGFVFSTLGHIPDVGEGFEFANARFTVTEAERTRINRVRIEMLGASASENYDQANGI